MRSRSPVAVVAIVLCFHVRAEQDVAVVASNHSNNVCPTFEDYHTVKDNPRCWYNFAADSSTVSLDLFITYLS